MRQLSLQIILLTVLALFYQNCSQVFFAPTDTRANKNSGYLEVGGGNGDPYEGKPHGEYVRQIPGWVCEGEPNDVYSHLSTATGTSSLALVSNPKDMCNLKKPDVSVDEITVFPTDNEIIAYKEGVYRKHSADESSNNVGLPQAWCRSWESTERLDMLVHKVGSELKAKVVLGSKSTQGWQLTTTDIGSLATSQTGPVLNYNQDQLKLDINLAKDAPDTVLQYAGAANLKIDGRQIQKNLSCRTARKYDPAVQTAYCDLRSSNSPFANSGEAGVDGSSFDRAYTICTAEQFNRIGSDLANWDKHYVLKRDIDMSSLGTTPYNVIGDLTTGFSGGIDGLDFQIARLTINQPTEFQLGLVGVGSDFTVRNISVSDIDITGVGEVGGIAGRSTTLATIESVRLSGKIQGRSFIGGLLGYGTLRSSRLAVSSSHANISIVATSSYVGGLIGAGSGSIALSTAKGQITSGVRSGGLVGADSGYPLSIIGSSAAVNIIDIAGGSSDKGGLVGIAWSDLTHIENSFATGDVEGTENIGGLIGQTYIATPTLLNVYATGNVNGSTKVGGLIGQGGPRIKNCYALGNVSASGSFAGGLVGQAGMAMYGIPPIEIENCFSTGHVTGSSTTSDVGLFAGYLNGTVVNSMYDSSRTCTNSGAGVCNTYGTPIDTTLDPTYFHTPANAPLDGWDFINTWIAIPGTYPQLR